LSKIELMTIDIKLQLLMFLKICQCTLKSPTSPLFSSTSTWRRKFIAFGNLLTEDACVVPAMQQQQLRKDRTESHKRSSACPNSFFASRMLTHCAMNHRQRSLQWLNKQTQVKPHLGEGVGQD